MQLHHTTYAIARLEHLDAVRHAEVTAALRGDVDISHVRRVRRSAATRPRVRFAADARMQPRVPATSR